MNRNKSKEAIEKIKKSRGIVWNSDKWIKIEGIRRNKRKIRWMRPVRSTR